MYNANASQIRDLKKTNHKAAMQLNIMQSLNYVYEELLVGRKMLLR